MKFNNIKAFEKHLASASPEHLCQLYFILGKEGFERKAAFEKLRTYYFKGQKADAFSVKTFEGERFSLAELMGELNAGALFAKKRIVLLQDAEKLDKASMQRLEGYFEKPNNSICLVISAASVNHSTNFYKKGEMAGIVLEMAEEKPWEKEKSIHLWIAEVLAAENRRISQPASQRLVKLLGPQQSVLQNELQKLICYIGDRKEIQVEDIAAITTTLSVETGWQLGDAIFGRDTASALRISKSMLNDGVPFILLLRQLRSQFQTGMHISGILAQGGTPGDITEKLPNLRGVILERNMRMAQGYGLKRYKEGLLKIDEIELQSKNSGIDHDLLAELVIIKLTE